MPGRCECPTRARGRKSRLLCCVLKPGGMNSPSWMADKYQRCIYFAPELLSQLSSKLLAKTGAKGFDAYCSVEGPLAPPLTFPGVFQTCLATTLQLLSRRSCLLGNQPLSAAISAEGTKKEGSANDHPGASGRFLPERGEFCARVGGGG